MNSILIKKVLLGNERKDIYIEGNRIKKIAPDINVNAHEVISGENKAAIPGFVNAHTHAAMTLFRGYGDDMPLMKWLTEKIWPNEAKLTRDDVYWGTKLACLEMIKSGTTTFIDMYMKVEGAADAVEEMGLRAMLSSVCIDHFNPEITKKCIAANLRFLQKLSPYSNRIIPALGPHAIYTVSAELLKWISRYSKEYNLPIHLHLAETEHEHKESVEKFGMTPVRYLNHLGVLSPRLILAHLIYVDDEEMQMLADHDVKVVHNPASNMKLGSGIEFKYCEMRNKGIIIGLGTDGCSSSNNLDMIEAMKLAALLGKGWRKRPEAITAEEIFWSATEAGAEIVRIDAGKIEEGRLADLSLVNLREPAFVPNHNFLSNLVYAANGSCIDTVICDGRILMKDRRVAGEEEIMEEVEFRAHKLVNS